MNMTFFCEQTGMDETYFLMISKLIYEVMKNKNTPPNNPLVCLQTHLNAIYARFVNPTETSKEILRTTKKRFFTQLLLRKISDEIYMSVFFGSLSRLYTHIRRQSPLYVDTGLGQTLYKKQGANIALRRPKT